MAVASEASNDEGPLFKRARAPPPCASPRASATGASVCVDQCFLVQLIPGTFAERKSTSRCVSSSLFKKNNMSFTCKALQMFLRRDQNA